MRWKSLGSFVMMTMLGTACGTNIVDLNGTLAHDVSVSVEIPASVCLATCDPPNVESHALVLIRIRNLGATTAFLRTCDSQIALEEQQLVGDAWVAAGPASDCSLLSSPITLAAGDSLRFNGFYANGTRRLVLGVGGNALLSDEILSTSAAFVVH